MGRIYVFASTWRTCSQTEASLLISWLWSRFHIWFCHLCLPCLFSLWILQRSGSVCSVKFSLPFLVGSTVVLDVVAEPLEDAYLGQTLKRSLVPNLSFEEQKRSRREELSPVSKITLGGDGAFEHASKDCGQQSNKSSSLQEGLLLFSDPCGWKCKTNHHISLLEVQEAALPWRLSRALLKGRASLYDQLILLSSL